MSKLSDLKREIAIFLHTYKGFSLPKQISTEPKPYDFNLIEMDVISPIEGVHDYYKVIILGYQFNIKELAVPLFIKTLEHFKPNELEKLRGIIDSPRDHSIKLIPHIPLSNIQFVPGEFEDHVLGVNFTRIDDRFEKLQNFIHTEFQHIAQHITNGAEKFNADDSKAKIDDVYVQFNTKAPGDDVEFFMTLSRLPAIFDPSSPIAPSMTPMTELEKMELFNYPTRQKEKAAAGITIKDEIDASMERINKRIQDFIHNLDAENYPSCRTYTLKIVNGILIPMIVTLQLEPYSFFGGTSQNLTDPEKPNANSTACSEIIDYLIVELFEHLNTIPIPDGSAIDHYAIDHDSFGIYGRDVNQKVVQAMVDPKYMFSTVFEPRFTTSFTEAFKRFLKTKKCPQVFTQIGKIDEKTIRYETNESPSKIIPENSEMINEMIEQAKHTPSEERVLETGLTGIYPAVDNSSNENQNKTDVNRDDQVKDC